MLLCNNLVPISRRGHRFRGLLGGIYIKINVRFWGEIDIQLTPSPAPFHRFLACTSLNGINLVPISRRGYRLRRFLGGIYTRINVRPQGKIDIQLTPSPAFQFSLHFLNGINLVPISHQLCRFLGGILSDLRENRHLTNAFLFSRLLVQFSGRNKFGISRS